VELEISEQLALLCDIRLEGGREGFKDALEDMSRADIESLFGEAVDALLDAETKHSARCAASPRDCSCSGLA
jgi:hypothetical protein